MVGLLHHTPKPDARAWVYGSDAYPLPDGLAQGTLVTFVRAEVGGVCTVRDADGREWSLRSFHVDCGNSFYNGREWLHESRPEVLAHLDQETERCLALLGTKQACAGTEKQIAWLQRLLRRNDRPFTNDAASAVAESFSFASLCYSEPGMAMNRN